MNIINNSEKLYIISFRMNKRIFFFFQIKNIEKLLQLKQAGANRVLGIGIDQAHNWGKSKVS